MLRKSKKPLRQRKRIKRLFGIRLQTKYSRRYRASRRVWNAFLDLQRPEIPLAKKLRYREAFNSSQYLGAQYSHYNEWWGIIKGAVEMAATETDCWELYGKAWFERMKQNDLQKDVS